MRSPIINNCLSVVSSFCALSVFGTTLAFAQLELRATAYADAVRVTTPQVSEDRASILAGVHAGYHIDPWSFSAEYASSGSSGLFGSRMDRSRSELTVGYSLSDSFELITGARTDDIKMSDVSVFYFFFFPIPVSVPEAEVELMNYFVGANYESDPHRAMAWWARRGFIEAPLT